MIILIKSYGKQACGGVLLGGRPMVAETYENQDIDGWKVEGVGEAVSGQRLDSCCGPGGSPSSLC